MKLDFFKKIKDFKISISAYLATLTAIVVILIAIILTCAATSNIANIIGEFESNAFTLRNSLPRALVQALKQDLKAKNLTKCKELLDYYKSEGLAEYIIVIDQNTGAPILGKSDYNNIDNIRSANIEDLSISFDKYNLYYGIRRSDTLDGFSKAYMDFICFVLLILVVIGVVTSMFFATVISKPLEDVSKAAKKITDGNFNIRIGKSNFTEINDLIYSYNEMAFQLNELYSSLELKVQERTIALETANYKLQETQAMMVHSEKMRSLGELVAGIAHEINNPVNFIHGNIMILQNYVSDIMSLIDLYDKNSETIPKEAKEEIEKLKKDIDLDFLKTDINDLIRSCIEGTQRTKNIILDLKNFSRMEERVLTELDLGKEIDTTLNILNNKYKNRITVIKNYPEPPLKIEAFGGQLNQVFMNILDNAQDAIEGEGTLTINIYKENEDAILEFIDSGKGIPEENLKKIFDPFFTTKAVGKGTGLGMSISYRVINDHNGKIEVESEVNKGTKFKITLPINHETKEKTMEEKIISDLREENGVEE